MTLKRTERKQRVRERRRIVYAFAGAAAVLLLGVLVVLRSLFAPPDPARLVGATLSQSASEEGTLTRFVGTSVVEVPDVRGKAFNAAEIVLQAAGLTVLEEGTSTPGGSEVVLEQDPAPGVKLSAGDVVRLRVQPKAGTLGAKGGFVVAIDPGHQERSDDALEPVGPGSKDSRQKANGGVTGAYTKREEYQVALEISMKLKAKLEAAGVMVVLTRKRNDVDLGNIARAETANRAHADVFVRVHGNASLDPKVQGVSTWYAGGNAWTARIAKRSKRVAALVQKSLTGATGAKDLGTDQRSDMTGFNWSKVPAILVQAGYMTNASEDRLLSNPRYQDKVAEGIAEGVLAYLRTTRE